MHPPTSTLFTLGYGSWKTTSKRIDGLISALHAAGVAMLIDTRHSPCASDPGTVGNYTAKPWNLRVAGEAGIADRLREAGVAYRWLVELGNPQKRDPQMTILRHQLATNDPCWPVNRGLTLLAEFVSDGGPCCLMCACAEFDHCHRSLIAHELNRRHFDQTLTIRDLRPRGQATVFPL